MKVRPATLSSRLPFHLDTILIPFACVSMGDGIFVLADVPSVNCASTDETFMTMFAAGPPQKVLANGCETDPAAK